MAVVMLKQMLPIDDRVINDFTARVDGVHGDGEVLIGAID